MQFANENCDQIAAQMKALGADKRTHFLVEWQELISSLAEANLLLLRLIELAVAGFPHVHNANSVFP